MAAALRHGLGVLLPIWMAGWAATECEGSTGRTPAVPTVPISGGPVVAEWTPTNAGNGADAELRESIPTQNRGTSTELASRIRNECPTSVSDRNSLFYVRFDLAAVPVPANLDSAFRLTYRNRNLLEPRIQDAVTPDPSVRTGLSVYGLDPTAAGVAWDETTITYDNAPGLTPDGDIGTRDLNTDLIYLGEVRFPPIGTQSHLPVGGALTFESPSLDQFVADALAGGATEVTLVAHVIHDGATPFADWINFNYLFNPKEQTTLNDDPNYDADTTDPGNPLGSPWSGADNTAGDFSPSLRIAERQVSIIEVPAAGSVGLAILAALLALAALARLRRAAADPSAPDGIRGSPARPNTACVLLSIWVAGWTTTGDLRAQALLLDQPPTRASSGTSELDCDVCQNGSLVVAEDFVLGDDDQSIRALTIWGGYVGDQVYDDDFTVQIFTDDAGSPAVPPIFTRSGVSSSRTPTGLTVPFSGSPVDEYVYTLRLGDPPILPAGTYWIEIANDSNGEPGDFVWGFGILDSANGRDGAALSTAGVIWFNTFANFCLQIHTAVFADGFESGDLSPWSESQP